jgi:hypothetical protein
MFSGRLPDHLLQAGTLLDEAAAFEAIVEEKEPLKTVLTQLHSDKLDLTSALDTTPTGAWECLAHLDPSNSLTEFGDTLQRKAALAMNTLWEAFLAWKSAEETTIATIKVLCCTVDVALKGVARQAHYPANLLFRHNKPRAVVMDELQRTPQESFVEHTETVVAIGDPCPRVVSVRAWHSFRLGDATY